MGKKISMSWRRGTHDKVLNFIVLVPQTEKKFFCTGLITYTTFNYRKNGSPFSPPLNKVILLLEFQICDFHI